MPVDKFEKQTKDINESEKEHGIDVPHEDHIIIPRYKKVFNTFNYIFVAGPILIIILYLISMNFDFILVIKDIVIGITQSREEYSRIVNCFLLYVMNISMIGGFTSFREKEHRTIGNIIFFLLVATLTLYLDHWAITDPEDFFQSKALEQSISNSGQ